MHLIINMRFYVFVILSSFISNTLASDDSKIDLSHCSAEKLLQAAVIKISEDKKVQKAKETFHHASLKEAVFRYDTVVVESKILSQRIEALSQDKEFHKKESDKFQALVVDRDSQIDGVKRAIDKVSSDRDGLRLQLKDALDSKIQVSAELKIAHDEIVAQKALVQSVTRKLEFIQQHWGCTVCEAGSSYKLVYPSVPSALPHRPSTAHPSTALDVKKVIQKPKKK